MPLYPLVKSPLHVAGQILHPHFMQLMLPSIPGKTMDPFVHIHLKIGIMYGWSSQISVVSGTTGLLFYQHGDTHQIT